MRESPVSRPGEKLVELGDTKLFGAGKVVPDERIQHHEHKLTRSFIRKQFSSSSIRVDWLPDSHPEGQVVVVEGALDVRHHVLLVHQHGEHLGRG